MIAYLFINKGVIVSLKSSARIKYIRQFHKLSITELAKELSLSQPYISQIENGSRAISEKLADAIHSKFPSISRKWVLTGEGQPWDRQMEATSLLLKDGLDILRVKGIQFKEELQFLLSLTQQAWSISGTATPAFMNKVAEAIALLLRDAKLSKMLHSYMESTLAPGSGYSVPIEQRPAWIMERIRQGEPINPDYLARSLIALVEDGEYEEFPLDGIVALLTPWIFWVARRGQLGTSLQEIGHAFALDPSFLLDSPINTAHRQDELPPIKFLSFEDGSTSLNIFLGREISGALKINFGAGQTEGVHLILDGHSIFALIHVMKYGEGDQQAKAGHWELTLAEESQSLRFKEAELFISRERIEQLSRLTSQIEKNDQLYLSIVKEAVERYGVV